MTIFSQRLIYHPSIRLSFGVPLEDVFEDGQIHPALKYLFLKIYENYIISCNSLSWLLRQELAYSCDIRYLENALSNGDAETINSMPASTLMWLLRHFLTCLPLPLLPKYTDRKQFNWRRLSDLSRIAIERRFRNFRCDECLVEKIATDLLRLPQVNLLLIGYFVNFLRTLMTSSNNSYERGDQMINLRAARALVNYFSASIFVRGRETEDQHKKSKIYQPLMLFLLIKWPQIQIRCVQKQPQCFVPPKNHLTNCRHFKIEHLDYIEHEDEEMLSDLDNSSYYSAEEVSIFKDASCQTEISNAEKPSVLKLKSNSAQTKIVTFQSVGTQISSPSDESVKQVVAEEILQPEVVDPYIEAKKSTSVLDDWKIDYQNLAVAQSTNTNSVCSEKDSKLSTKDDLARRVSKTGWTYDKHKELARKLSRTDTSIGKEVEKEDLMEPEKDDASLKTLPSSENLNNAAFEEFNEIEVPLTKKSRHLSALGKLKSHLDFMKIFKSKAIVRSASAEFDRSRISYKKMCSSQSNTF